MTDPRERDAPTALLVARRAGEIAHPGGTLLEHLRRVRTLLERWGARPTVLLAGLSHAFYGTDGFPVALGEVAERDLLASVIGEEAEQLVYFYGSCDRAFSYPRLLEGAFKDRFTGAVLSLSPSLRRDFAEITVANELDVLNANPELRTRHGQELFRLVRLVGGPAQRSRPAGRPDTEPILTPMPCRETARCQACRPPRTPCSLAQASARCLEFRR